MNDAPQLDERLHEIRERVVARNVADSAYLRVADEILESISVALPRHPEWLEDQLIERVFEPERQLVFRVPWTADDGTIRMNRGYRIQHSSALGPYKGGLRFHPTVTHDVVAFLAFEQVFKNALTGLSLGAGKGGADFDPKGRSPTEVMRFCQSFMTELHRHLGATTDVPAGDIGVGEREIGWLYGQYARIVNRVEAGVLTGKGLDWGGSHVRKEATGFGLAYFAEAMLAERDEALEGTTCVVSGAGNVARYTVAKLQALGAKVVACSDSGGTVHDPDGLDLDAIVEIKEVRRASLEEYLQVRPEAEHMPAATPWSIPCDAAFPCATQDELDEEDARTLVANGVRLVAEGANLPCTHAAIGVFLEAGVAFGPGKAANAGGVATSALEMRQNAGRTAWSFETTDARLRDVMVEVHRRCMDAAEELGRPGDLVLGANVAGFRTVARAVRALGAV